ncbi:hypothetical protein ACFZDJ_35200 [Streptomyces sp. NPDC007896]|uniref:hypothetical protein n=1 Tax=Streptomyces sp. NPDC007896 TaxID=3364784 RepID=UPI0036E41D08
MSVDDGSLKGIWLAIIALSALFGAGVAAAVFWMAGQGVSAVLAAGGAAFVGVATLGMAARKFLVD